MARILIGVLSVLCLLGCAGSGGRGPHTAIDVAEIKPASPQSGKPLVYIEREVRHAGCYVWINGMKLTDLIEAAGGLTDFAGHRISIVHADGARSEHRYDHIKKHGRNDPLLSAGDKVWVTGDLL
jgi:protein involved in polysaccharide export with SLBB domain